MFLLFQIQQVTVYSVCCELQDTVLTEVAYSQHPEAVVTLADSENCQYILCSKEIRSSQQMKVVTEVLTINGLFGIFFTFFSHTVMYTIN